MLIISRTPVRISFFGGGTDYPAFYENHPGAVLGTTINQYSYISVKTLKSSFFDHNIRIGYSKTELVNAVKEIEHPSVRECLKKRGIETNLDIHIFSDLPARSGLGSSSSFTVGFLQALDALQSKTSTKQQLAEEACHVEQKCIKENVGSQDQFHAAFGGFNCIEFQNSEILVRPLGLSSPKKEQLEEHLMVFFTGITRFASEIVQEQIDKTRSREINIHLQQMHRLVGEAEDLLLTSSEESVAERFGSLLAKSWELKKLFSKKITNPTIDQAYKAALDAGAYGGKLCGAGNGGFLAFFVPPSRQEKVREALKGLNEVAVRFEDQGSTLIYRKD